MSWSARIARVRGIDIHVHLTLALVVGWIAVSAYLEHHTLAAALGSLAFVAALFASIVLHELGHALVAARFGVRTRDITLYPIGGVARMDRIPERPLEELAIAVAGPLVNVAIAVVLGVGLSATGGSIWPSAKWLSADAPFVARVLWLNVWIAAFNLVPALPMDGGRMLRAALATRMSHVRATQLAGRVSRAIAVGLAVIGVFASPMLLVLALFVWLAGTAELADVEARAILRRLPVRAAMMTDLHSVAPDTTIVDAMHAMVGSGQTDFPVIDGGRMVGVLTRHALVSALASHAPTSTVRGAMETRFALAGPDETIDVAIERLARLEDGRPPPSRSIAVVEGGQLVGLLTPESVGELLFLERALLEAPRAAIPRGRIAVEAA